RRDRRNTRAQIFPRDFGGWLPLRAEDDRGPVSRDIAEHLLGVVEAGAGEPMRAGHLMALEDGGIRTGWFQVEELPDRLPEVFQMRDRPVPEAFIVIGMDALM